MKRILYFVPRFASGGAEAFIVNVIEKIVLDGYSCSILSIDGEDSVYDGRLKSIGVKREVLVSEAVSNPITLYLKAYTAFSSYLSQRKSYFDVIHFNIAQGEELPFIWMAKRANIPIRIMHSHNSSTNSILKRVCHTACLHLFRSVATTYFACSDEAAKWLVPKRIFESGAYSIINNGIPTEKFRFKTENRERVRRSLGITDERCYINVGRLDKQKNHALLLKVFRTILSDDPDSFLLCVGEGPLEGELIAMAEKLRIDHRVKWLGIRKDIPDLLCGADCFLLPSLFEGFPLCLIEAQSSGLPCVVSDTVSKQCAITDLVKYAELDSRLFARTALDSIERPGMERCCYADEVAAKGYDIDRTVRLLERCYDDKEVSDGGEVAC